MEYVYVAEAGQYAKIGLSRNPRIRVHSLSYQPARLVYVILCDRAREVEQRALLSLADVHIGDEYLDCGARLAIAAVKFAALKRVGRYVEVLDALPARWANPVDKRLGLIRSSSAASSGLSP